MKRKAKMLLFSSLLIVGLSISANAEVNVDDIMYPLERAINIWWPTLRVC